MSELFTKKSFWKLSRRDFDNGAIIDDVGRSLGWYEQRIAELEAALRASWDDPDYRRKRPKLWARVEEVLEDE